MPLSIKVNLRVTGHCNQGGRKYMEDMFSVAYQQTSDDKDLEYAFFGIFDGHGGGEAATFAKEHLMDIIVKQRNFWSDKDEDVLRAIRDGYVNTHYAMWRELEKWPRTASGLPSTAGTTASVAFIRKGKIYIGHVGDSGIILGYQEEGDPQWKAKPLTNDHKPESVLEMIRIQESGGKVVSKSGVPRVVWNRPRIGHKGPVRRSTHIDEIPFLAVARSLGDLWSYNSELDTFVVSPEPDVKVVTVDVKSHRCLIFGTDGLWNVLTPQAAVAIVQAAERHNEKHLIASQQTGNGQADIQMWINPSKSLVDRALERWSSARLRADNTSVVTLMLDPPGPSRSEVLMSRKNERVVSPKTFVPTPSVFTRPPASSTENIPTPIDQSTTVLPSVEEISAPKNPDTSQPSYESPTISNTKIDVVSSKDDDESTPKHSRPTILPSTSRESIQVPEISSSNASDDAIESHTIEENREIPPKTVITSEEQKIVSLAEKPEIVDSCSESPTESTSNVTTLLHDVPSPTKYPIDEEKIDKENPTRVIRQNCFYNPREEFKNRPRLRRNCGTFGGISTLATERNANSQDSTIKTELTSVTRRRQSQNSASLTSHLESRTAIRRRQSVNTTTTTTTTTSSSSSCLAERKKSYFGAVGSRVKREIAYLGITRDHRTLETINSRGNELPAKIGQRTLTGSKRRHSSTSEPPEDVNCSLQEPMAKRRTRSEDRPIPTDENQPANQEKQRNNRLRWPDDNSASSRLRSESNLRSCGSTSVVNTTNVQEKSPNSFQRRSLEKKATPVKTIRRPSINGSNRIQLRANFSLRDWDQSKTVHRDRGRLNRTVGNVIGSTDSSPTPNLQRWLRSDTLAATPVKTLRSRNVDITGHTVPAQIAHQYGVVKQNRLSLPAKIKLAGKISKLSASSSSASSSSSGTNLSTGKLQKQNGGNGGNNTTTLNAGSSGSGITKRVKSPYNPTARSALGTRSRLKRLGK